MTTNGPLKYAYCPFDESKCYAKAVSKPQSDMSGILMTTVGFGETDSCAWRLQPQESEFYFIRRLNISLGRAVDTDCKIYYGKTLDDLENNMVDCTGQNKTDYTFESNQHVVIVVQGNTPDASIEFQY